MKKHSSLDGWLRITASALLPYVIAVLAVALALLGKLLVDPYLEADSPFFLFYGAVTVSAWYGGLGPGLLATILAAGISNYFFLQPVYSFKIVPLGQALRMVQFLGEGLLISSLSAILQSARQRAELNEHQAKLEVTERRRAEETLRETNTTLQAIIQASPLALWAMDLEGLIKFWNPAAEQIFGWSQREVLNRPSPVGAHREQGESELLLERCREGESLTGLERRWHRKDGSPVDISLWTAPLRDNTGSIRGTLCVVADIAELKQLAEQLRQSQKMEAVGRLAGGVAHDFNNLLTAITGYSELLQSRFSPADPAHGEIEEIRNAAGRATALTGQLLAFSRKQILAPQVLDLNAVLINMERMLQRLIGEDISLVTVREPALQQVKADRGQIEQVILNLAINARDAMPQGGQLTLETANVELDEAYARQHVSVVPGRFVMLGVSDTGQGMDKEMQSRIFEPFFTTKGIGKGTGLGLSTVYGIVKQSGGHIWVYSEQGRGTTFKIYLPEVEENVEPARVVGNHARLTGGWETVLLVEDEEAVRGLACEILRRNGYAVLAASNGTEALQIDQHYRGPIHLLVTDVVMPQISGPEVAERLSLRRQDMRVLYLSGYTDEAIVRHGVLEVGTAFLQKPFTPVALALKVREVLDQPPAD